MGAAPLRSAPNTSSRETGEVGFPVEPSQVDVILNHVASVG